jgi:hypothetical protein
MLIMPDAALLAPVHMIKLTKEREIAAYGWVHPDDDDRR